jgi:hypothetical protein
MTLIAGFPSSGTPVLIGDLLTSNDSGPSGFAKKILIIRENFALGWTGHMVAAQSVIRSLQSSLNPNSIKLETVRAILTDPATSDLGLALRVQLICWVIDSNGHHCLFWDSHEPMVLSLEPAHYAGSGASTALHIVGSDGFHYSSPPDWPPDPHQVERGALTVTSRLMDYEMWGPSTKALGFGHAYEIIRLVDGTRFKYIDNALYVPILVELDENGRYLKNHFGTAFFKYHAYGNCSVIHIYNPTASHIDVQIIEPLGEKSPQADEIAQELTNKKPYFYPFKSDFYCFVFVLKSQKFLTPPYSVIIPEDEVEIAADTIVRMNISNKIFEIELNRNWTESSYKVIREGETNTHRSDS